MDHLNPDANEDMLPLRDRMPDYVATFGVGLGVAVVVGVIVWQISEVSPASSIGYSIILYGVVLLLAGGASGGGYTNLGAGAIGSMFGAHRTDGLGDDSVEGSTRHGERPDPRDRLRAGLRPEANSRAFWQVIGGGLYVAIGLGVVVTWS